MASASSIFSLRTGASLSSATDSVIAFSSAAAARRRLTIRQAIEAPTISQMTRMTPTRTPTLSNGCASPMKTIGPANQISAARTRAATMLSAIQSQATIVMEMDSPVS